MAWLTAGWLVGWLPWPGSERTADTKPRLHSKIGVGWLDCLPGLTGWLAEPLAKQLAYLRRQIQALLEDWSWLVGLAGWQPGWPATHFFPADRRMLFGSQQDSCSEKSLGVKCCSVCNNILVQTWSVCSAIVKAGVECCSNCNNIVVQTWRCNNILVKRIRLQSHRHAWSRMLFRLQQHSCSDICKVAFRAGHSSRKFFWKWGP